MKLTKLSLVAALAVSTAFAGGDIAPVEPMVEAPAPVVEETSALEISANLAITSNYVWRGWTQTSNSPAVQGGIDLGYKGFYIGTWGSNVSWTADNTSSLEADFYAGYKGEIGSFGYDIGYAYYAYPNVSDDYNFDEAYLKLSYDFDGFAVNGSYYIGVDSEVETTDYWDVGASADLMGVTLAATYGEYDEFGSNYIVSISKTFGKFDIALAYTDYSDDTFSSLDEDHIVGTISTSF